MIVYRDQEKLILEGEVVLAMLVQEHCSLFKRGAGATRVKSCIAATLVLMSCF